MNPPSVGNGIRIVGTGSFLPDQVLSNKDLEKMFDTSDEWITQRTGISTRHIVDASKGGGTISIACEALASAISNTGFDPLEIDLIICGTCTQEMTCPSAACRAQLHIGAFNAAAFDLAAACSGFIYGFNLADSLIRQGSFKTIAVIGADAMSTVVDYTERSVSILFGDAAGAVILTQDDDPARGGIHQILGADPRGWDCLYMPRREVDIPDTDKDNPIGLGNLRMKGREVFKFAVKKFTEMIEETLDQAGITIDEVSQLICHQSNLRIIENSREKLGIPRDRVYVNIERVGNSSAGSIGLSLDELNQAGKIVEGEIILLAAIGGGMTWGTSLWRV